MLGVHSKVECFLNDYITLSYFVVHFSINWGALILNDS